ncbi:MAG: hypothetical protein JXA21_18980 [Anaerolineae bacterium]|nr:hypothetical protein [Anaerolineae bacterium]
MRPKKLAPPALWLAAAALALLTGALLLWNERAITYAPVPPTPDPTVMSPSLALLAAGGPDRFGYTWDDTVPYAWASLTAPVTVSLRNDDWAGPFAIGFSFSFYEHAYSQFFIDSNGYIGFDVAQTSSYAGAASLPAASRPQNVIAPFWQDFDPARGGTVRYQVLGTAPNRSLVVEWAGVPLKGTNALQSFQVILYETSNNIRFQYPDTRQGADGDLHAAVVGIENADGALGLRYPNAIPATQTLALQFTYHRLQYNGAVMPFLQGASGLPGQTITFPLSLRNLGTSTDVFTFTAIRMAGIKWTVKFCEADGVTPLSNSMTGELAPGAGVTVTARMSVPSDAVLGDWSRMRVRTISVGDPMRYTDVYLDGVYGSSFAQVYSDDAGGDGTEDAEIYFDGLLAGQRYSRRLTADLDGSTYAGVAALSGGRSFHLWNAHYDNGAAAVDELYYAVLDHEGKLALPVTRLTNLKSATHRVSEVNPVATASGDRVLVAWTWQVDADDDGSVETFNIGYALVTGHGETLKTPAGLTTNTGSYPRDHSPAVTALQNGRFLLAWQHDTLVGGTPVSNVYYAVLNSDGSVYKTPAALTSGQGLNATPSVTTLSTGYVAVVWAQTAAGATTADIVWMALSNRGVPLVLPSAITANAGGESSLRPDAAALSDGRLAVAWTQAFPWGLSDIQYTLLDVDAGAGIHGQLFYQDAPAAGLILELRFYDGSAWSTPLTTTTAADGRYQFVGAPALAAGQRYYVRYSNGMAGNALNPDYLDWWRGPTLTAYTAGNEVAGGDFDLAGIAPVSPASGAHVTLSHTFAWTPRPATPEDSYELHVYGSGMLPWVWTDPALGYVSYYALGDLPSDFAYGTEYHWAVGVRSPDGGRGLSRASHTITFDDPAGSRQGIYGRVTDHAAPVGGITLVLRFFDGSAWSNVQLATTAADGVYEFAGAPGLAAGQSYYVRYENGANGNARDSQYLNLARSFSIETYGAGALRWGGDLEIADIPLVAPSSGAVLALPATFLWTPRGMAYDHYRLGLHCSGDGVVYTLPDVGTAGSHTLTTLPATCAGQWSWLVRVYPTADEVYTLGYGESYAMRTVDFVAAAPAEALPDGGPLAGEVKLPLEDTPQPAVSASQRLTPTIYTVLGALVPLNDYVSLTADAGDHLIMTWPDVVNRQYVFYALADDAGTLLTPATVYRRTRHSAIWSSGNGSGNAPLTALSPVYPNKLYLPLVFKQYTFSPAPLPLVNGDFEAGALTGWVAGRTTDDAEHPAPLPVITTTVIHGGSYAVLLGEKAAVCQAPPGAIGFTLRSWIEQELHVPTAAPQLRFYYRIVTYDKLIADTYDRFEVYLDGTLVGRFGNEDAYGCAVAHDLGWRAFTYDLSAYRGRTVTLRLLNVTAPDAAFPTWTYVDDVSLIAQ